MQRVKPKKRLGQHFLKDNVIAGDIVKAYLTESQNISTLEIGPGTGVLSALLVDAACSDLVLMDLDEESIDYLKVHYQQQDLRIMHADFLKSGLQELFEGKKFGVIGNFPYNISSQIFFKILENTDQIPLVVGMLQKEVAERIASAHGSKVYGILSVLIQAYYDVEYLFTVPPEVFDPPPKVQSGVIRLTRNKVSELGCDQRLFMRVVKAAFQTRRKTLRNALKPLNLPDVIKQDELMDKRAEQLSVNEFVQLTQRIENHD